MFNHVAHGNGVEHFVRVSPCFDRTKPHVQTGRSGADYSELIEIDTTDMPA